MTPSQSIFSPLAYGLLVMLSAIGISSAVADAPEVSAIARALSPSIREMESRLQGMAVELSALPEIPSGPKGGTLGFHAAYPVFGDLAHESWVQIDLGKLRPIDEVRVFPARPIDWAESHGFGFPECFHIEASLTPEFDKPISLFDRTQESAPNPGDNAIVVPLDELEVRYVRFTATKLWRRERNTYLFALAEMQVIADGMNVANNARVSASDAWRIGRWASAYLVDGYDSRQAIEDDELAWIRSIVRRKRLLEESAQLETSLSETAARANARLITFGSIALVTVQIEIHDKRFTLQITDSGRGFDQHKNASNPGAGLKNMVARARTMGDTVEFESNPQPGTTVLLSIPIGT